MYLAIRVDFHSIDHIEGSEIMMREILFVRNAECSEKTLLLSDAGIVYVNRLGDDKD